MSDQTTQSVTVARKDYWLEEDGKTVTTDLERAAFLLIRGGQEVTNDLLQQYPSIQTDTKKVDTATSQVGTYKERMAAQPRTTSGRIPTVHLL